MITRLYVWFLTMRDEERGATAVEYGMLAALIAAFLVASVTVLRGAIADAFTTVSGAISGGG